MGKRILEKTPKGGREGGDEGGRGEETTRSKLGASVNRFGDDFSVRGPVHCTWTRSIYKKFTRPTSNI